MLKLTDIRPGIVYFAYGQQKLEELGSKVFMVIVKKRQKFHILRVVVPMQEGWDEQELLNFHIENIRVMIQKKHFPRSRHVMPAKVIDFEVGLDDFTGCVVE